MEDQEPFDRMGVSSPLRCRRRLRRLRSRGGACQSTIPPMSLLSFASSFASGIGELYDRQLLSPCGPPQYSAGPEDGSATYKNTALYVVDVAV